MLAGHAVMTLFANVTGNHFASLAKAGLAGSDRRGFNHELMYGPYVWKLCPKFQAQKFTGGSLQVGPRGRARARATSTPHKPAQALRPGRQRQMFKSPLHFA
jgi:hypothetical protein